MVLPDLKDELTMVWSELTDVQLETFCLKKTMSLCLQFLKNGLKTDV
jgi:hypothetical protein